MKVFLKVFAIAVVLALLCLAGFGLWGEQFEKLFGREECVRWFGEIRPVAWLVAIGLLMSDLVLPVPATGVIAALGVTYGTVVGAAVGAAGSLLSALLGYSLARLLGERAVRFLAGEDEIERFRNFFDRWGGAGVIVSRAMPVLPEVMSVLAGLARMSFGRFLVAVLLGTVPASLFFAYLGAASAEEPWYGIVAAALIPLLLWPVFLHFVRRRDR